MSYAPDSGAAPAGTDTIALLSQRDLSLRVPINFVPHPGVAVRPACFGADVFDRTAAAKCFSNLLAVGFRRLDLDLYWDSSRTQWSFCPVQLGGATFLPTATDGVAPTVTKIPSASLATAHFSANGDAILTAGGDGLIGRAESKTLSISESGSSQSSTSSSAISTTVTLSSSTSSSGSVSQPTSGNGALVKIGPYSCDGNVDFKLFTDVLSTYLEDTETDIHATTKYVTLNLHAAASASDPTGSASQIPSDKLPGASHALSGIIATNLSSYLYTPSELLSQRANLNTTGSWFSVYEPAQPDAAYFNVATINYGLSTSDGWPSESFIELQKAKRLIAAFGEIDPQMGAYNFAADVSSIFPARYIESPSSVEFKTDGNVSSGCFYKPDVDSVAAVNSSWAIHVADSTDPRTMLYEAGNLTLCGISPYLNSTLDKATADGNFKPYRAFADQAIWAWGPGEPRNVTGTNDEDDVRCAALNITSGRMQSADCGASHSGACHYGGTPYTWMITDSPGSYTVIDKACKHTSTFSVPHTAVEKRHLLAAWEKARTDHPDDDVANDPLLWLNFNDLDTQFCWVEGQNARCPYLNAVDEDKRAVVVPVVAAVIVFVLAVLTVFVKCAANRTNSHRGRRRAADGWDYEGVPS